VNIRVPNLDVIFSLNFCSANMNSPSSKIIDPSSDPEPEVLVKVENVGKIFCRDLKKSLLYGVRDSLWDLTGRRKTGKMSGERSLRKGEFWANKGISFELRRGECLGLIGHNGAGKTTLLKMLNGLIKPDTGSIEMHGRVGALIALGAGFNPILTGRENVYINGSVLGLKKREVDEIIDEIIDFAEIREFIDAPVQSYSSGMQVRLGFAIASRMEPDVLIIDEVLAVGDRSFRQKCLDHIGSIMADTAIIFVSHQAELLAHICTKGVVLQAGQIIHSDDINNSLTCYDKSQSDGKAGSIHRSNDAIDEFSLSVDSTTINWGECITLMINMKTTESGCFGMLQIYIRDTSEKIVAEWNSNSHPNYDLSFEAGNSSLCIKIEDIKLAQGAYKLTVNGYDHTGVSYLMSSVNELKLNVSKGVRSASHYQL
jgi:lipopolysaccharide transport system ATP-binding protein